MKINAIQKLQMVLFLLFAFTTAFGQEASVTQNAIRNQFDHILENSESYRDLKIVKTKWLQDLKQNVSGSYAKVESQLLETKVLADNQKNEITALKNKLQQTNASLSAYTNAGPTVTFLGIEFDQVVFGTLFSILFFGSLILACLFGIKFNKSNEITKSAKNVLAELEEEYQEYKRRTIEREQKISRQLQDEINKNKQFMQMKAS